ncbi:MAG: MBL fold metallo-hydrolase [Eubacterium sp.]
MSTVTIHYYGHSCFKISSDAGSVILDPYEDGSVPGTLLPRGLEADAVYCSHDHHDHNAAGMIKLSGKPAPFPASFITVPHDDVNGKKRGLCRMTFLQAGGLTIAHLGDLGRLPGDEEYEQLSQADVLLVPCAGYYTIDSSQAKTILARMKTPSLKILMHFRDGKRGYDVQEDIQEIMKVIPGVKRLNETEITVESDDVPDEIVTLEPELR